MLIRLGTQIGFGGMVVGIMERGMSPTGMRRVRERARGRAKARGMVGRGLTKVLVKVSPLTVLLPLLFWMGLQTLDDNREAVVGWGERMPAIGRPRPLPGLALPFHP